MSVNWIHELLIQGSNEQISNSASSTISLSSFYTPGDVITSNVESFICGDGTFLDKDSSSILSTVAGSIEYINKLVRVIPPKTRYFQNLSHT